MVLGHSHWVVKCIVDSLTHCPLLDKVLVVDKIAHLLDLDCDI